MDGWMDGYNVKLTYDLTDEKERRKKQKKAHLLQVGCNLNLENSMLIHVAPLPQCLLTLLNVAPLPQHLSLSQTSPTPLNTRSRRS